MPIPTADEIEAKFSPRIALPHELRQLCSWVQTHGYPISGCFEIRANYYDAIRYWFGKDTVTDRFGMFGAGADGSLYNLWIQDDGRIPIVHMGSEGENNFVLASNFKEFLRLLAVGYDEIGFDDLSVPPKSEDINPEFQSWVRETFQVSIPTVGTEITLPAQAQHQDFQAWIEQVLK
jgi:hypothetical protein